MDISGLDKAAVLAALYNGSRQQGMGFLHTRGSQLMSVEQARNELKRGTYFDYLHGRVLKVDLSADHVATFAYNRDVGDGAAEGIIQKLRDSLAKEEV